MGKYKIAMVAGMTSVFFILAASLVVLNTENPIRDFIRAEEGKADQMNGEDVLAKGKDFTITKEDFTQYEQNLAFIYKQNGIPFSLHAEDIMNEMVENELLYSYAKGENIKDG